VHRTHCEREKREKRKKEPGESRNLTAIITGAACRNISPGRTEN